MVSKHASVHILSWSVNIHLFINHGQFILLCWGLTTRQPLWVILCCLPEKGRKESRGDEREGQGIKRKINESEETEEIKTSPSTLACYKDSRPCPAVSQYQFDAPMT